MVTVFEVDHPATQAVKREVFARLGIPATVQFVATDFERDDFVVKLCAARFVSERRSLVVWLGVMCYLTMQAITCDESNHRTRRNRHAPGLRLHPDRRDQWFKSQPRSIEQSATRGAARRAVAVW